MPILALRLTVKSLTWLTQPIPWLVLATFFRSGNMKQVVLVTGAASGLGNVIAEYFASQGHQVILSASTLEKPKMLRHKVSMPKICFL